MPGPPPSQLQPGAKKGRIPFLFWVVGGGIVLAVGYKLYQAHKASSSVNASNAQTAQAVTNAQTTQGQTLNTWPYDQLTPPYNQLNMPGMVGGTLSAGSQPYAYDTFTGNTAVPT